MEGAVWEDGIGRGKAWGWDTSMGRGGSRRRGGVFPEKDERASTDIDIMTYRKSFPSQIVLTEDVA